MPGVDVIRGDHQEVGDLAKPARGIQQVRVDEVQEAIAAYRRELDAQDGPPC